MNRKLNFLFVSHTSGLGGAEIAMLETMRGLLHQGHNVHAILPNAGSLENKLSANNISYSIIPFDHWTGYGQLSFWTKLLFIKGFIRSALAISTSIRQLKAHLVVTNTSTFPAAALGAAFSGVPHIWHLHEFVEEDHGLNWYFGSGFSYKLIARLSKAVVCTSNAVKIKASRLMPQQTRLQTIYCACTIQPKQPGKKITHQPLRLVMAGSISKGKNQIEACKAVALLASKGIEVHLTLVGHLNPNYANDIYLIINQLKKPENITIQNFTDDVANIYDSADVFLMTSKMEAFGRVLVEAQKRGLPCIGPDSGGVPEILGDGKGVLYQPGNDEDLASKIHQLIENTAFREQIANKGFTEAIKHFGEQQNASAFANLAEEVIE